MTHDGMYHIERTFNYVAAFRESNFPPAWARFYNNDFGSPLFVFLFPVVYLVSSFFNFIGVNLVTSLKLTFLFFQFIAAISMFLWLKHSLKFSSIASLVGSIFYIFSPYNISQVFVRGSLREFASTALFPLVLFAVTKLSNKPTRKSIGLAGLIIGLFLLADGLTAVVFLLPLISYLLYLFISSAHKLKFTFHIFISFLLGLLISSFIYLPFLSEHKYLKEVTTNLFQDHFVYFAQLFDFHWGFGFSLPGPKDGMSFQIGIINLMAIGLLSYLLLRKKLKFNLLILLFAFNLVISLFLLLQTPFSFHLWEQTPLKYLQLPWRFLSVIILITSFYAATVAHRLKINFKGLIAIYILVLLISARYLRTNQIVVFNSDYLSANTSDATAWHEFIPRFRDTTSNFAGFPQKIEVVSGASVIQNLKIETAQLSFESQALEPTKIRINTLYFPGWQAFIDQKSVNIAITENPRERSLDKRDLSGLMEISLSPGQHQVKLRFMDTPARETGKVLTLLGLSVSLILLII